MNTTTITTTTPPAVLPSVAAYKKYGLRRSQVHYLLVNHFTITEELQDVLATYYILSWTPKYFQSQLSYGTITRDNCEYLVVYKKGLSRGKVLQREQVWLSFRAAQPEFELPAYVLIG